MTDFKPVRKACIVVGGALKLSRALGVSVNTISEWATFKRPVPIIRCVQIEELTGGAVTRKQLRPDDWYKIWPEIRSPEQAKNEPD